MRDEIEKLGELLNLTAEWIEFLSHLERLELSEADKKKDAEFKRRFEDFVKTSNEMQDLQS